MGRRTFQEWVWGLSQGTRTRWVGQWYKERHMSSFLEDRKRILTLLRASHIHFLILEL